jgi:hypothetical protein
MGCPSSKGKEQPQHLLQHSFRNALIAAGEINEDDKKAGFKDWKTNIQSATLKEWRAQSKTCLRQWTLERERHEDRQRTQNRIREALTQKTAQETEN